MKKLILFFIALIVPPLLKAGTFSIAVSPGYGMYSMKTLQRNLHKDLIEYKTDEYKVDYKAVENYPGNIFWGGELRYMYKSDHHIGIGYQYHSTGARLSYMDYSGELRTDIINEGNILYLLYNRQYNVTEDFAITLLINYNLIFTNMDILDYTQLGSDVTTDKTACYSFAHALSLGFDFSQRLGALELGIRVTFMHDMNNLIISGDYMTDQKEKSEQLGETEAEWNGIRAGLIFAYHL